MTMPCQLLNMDQITVMMRKRLTLRKNQVSVRQLMDPELENPVYFHSNSGVKHIRSALWKEGPMCNSSGVPLRLMKMVKMSVGIGPPVRKAALVLHPLVLERPPVQPLVMCRSACSLSDIR